MNGTILGILLVLVFAVLPATAVVVCAKRGWRYRHLSEFSLVQKLSALYWVFLLTGVACSFLLVYVHFMRYPYSKLAISAVVFFITLSGITAFAEYFLRLREAKQARQAEVQKWQKGLHNFSAE